MITEFVKISDVTSDVDRQKIRQAAEILCRGGLVVFPTETVYGLGGNATDPTAAERIYSAKGRPSDNPLIIHIATPEEAEKYAVTSPLYYRLASAFFPGPLTVILPVRDTIPKTVTAGLPTVAVRCPSHPVANALIREAGVPIAAPSANLSGSPSPTSARHVRDDMDGRVDVILDGGECEIGLESTIVKIEEDGTLTLLRPGAITPEDLSVVAPEVRIASAVLGALKTGEQVLSPGMKYKHYAPKTPFALLEGSEDQVAAFLHDKGANVAFFAYEEDIPLLRSCTKATLIAIGSRNEPQQLAKRLFWLLRECDKKGYTEIYADLPVPRGLGLALYNRMIRAAAHKIITL
ncbi:MAG: threonylcarbamoyl-AMP synthase [Clostridia bacterium]|nr:threonylcarbamoyl-AMP synthase [Clostridia bacterium]